LKVIDQHTAVFVDTFERNFDNDVFVPKDIREQITSALDNFMNSSDWYIKNKIPYHFGIMLYGPAGTGKTSIAQAIANYVKATMYVVSGDDILKLPAMMDNGRAINTFGLTKNDFNIVLIEDIDCGLSYKSLYARGSRLGSPWATDWDDEEKLDKFQDNNGLATVLNTIDGIGAPRNTIFIFTTNHVEKLDSALIRPGRIDLSLEIKNVCLETFKEFMVHHFGEDVKIPNNLVIKNDLTFADLQVKVMSGMSAKDIIDYVKDNTKKYSSKPIKFGEIEPEDMKCAKSKKK
jgi:ATP-dependent 26S proteasome regulatory subunit